MSLRVLLVIGTMVEMNLGQEGYLVTWAHDGEAGLDQARGARFDAIVLDVHLADSNEGWEIAELVSALGVSNTRIVFQTGSPEAIPPHIRRMGPVLTKPYDPQDLVAALMEKPKAGLLALLRRK